MFLLFSLGALLLTLQTQFAYSMFLNPTANILVAFALTFLYKGVWYQRLFISFTLFVVAVLGEGSAWLTGQFFFTVKDMTHANEEQHFLIICILAVIFELVYVCIILSFIKYFKKHACKLNTFYFIFNCYTNILYYFTIRYLRRHSLSCSRSYSLCTVDFCYCRLHLLIQRSASCAA